MMQMLHSRVVLVSVLGVGLLAGACERRNEGTYNPGPMSRTDPTPSVPSTPSMPPTPSVPPAQGIGGGPTTLAFNDAIASIAQARCDHEQRCDHVGTGRNYASTSACLASVRNDFSDDLNASECPGGVDQRELNECLQEVRNENCGNPLDTLGRIVACRTSDLCRATR